MIANMSVYKYEEEWSSISMNISNGPSTINISHNQNLILSFYLWIRFVQGFTQHFNPWTDKAWFALLDAHNPPRVPSLLSRSARPPPKIICFAVAKKNIGPAPVHPPPSPPPQPTFLWRSRSGVWYNASYGGGGRRLGQGKGQNTHTKPLRVNFRQKWRGGRSKHKRINRLNLGLYHLIL